MLFRNLVFAILFGKIVRGDADCKPVMEILQIQDVSTTFSDNIAATKVLVGDMISRMQNLGSRVRYGVASFSDKGLPQVGVGPRYGAWGESPYAMDSCYTLNQPLTSNATEVSESLSKLFTSGGEDFEESQLDALLNAVLDTNVGWSVGNVAEDGVTPIVKIALIITDGFAHGPGYVQYKINEYNSHYGADEKIDSWVYSDRDGRYVDWIKLRTLRQQGNLHGESAKYLKFLDKRYLPFSFIDPLTPFEYNAESYYANNKTCHDHDYPDVDDPKFGALIRAAGVIPVVIALPPLPDRKKWSEMESLEHDQWLKKTLGPKFCPTVSQNSLQYYVECTDEYWTGLMTKLGVPSIVQVVPNGFAPDDFVVLLERTINIAIQDLFCEEEEVHPTKPQIGVGGYSSATAIIEGGLEHTNTKLTTITFESGYEATNNSPLLEQTGTADQSIAGDDSSDKTKVGDESSADNTSADQTSVGDGSSDQSIAFEEDTATHQNHQTTSGPIIETNAMIIGASTAGALMLAGAAGALAYTQGFFTVGSSTPPTNNVVESIEVHEQFSTEREMMQMADGDMFA